MLSEDEQREAKDDQYCCEQFELLDRSVEDASVAVQGYGNAGATAAKLLEDIGATIVSVSESSGGIYNADRLDIQRVADHKSKKVPVTGYDGADETLTNEELLTLDVDLLISAALENAIDEELAADVQADVIVEAANGPITPAADTALTGRNV